MNYLVSTSKTALTQLVGKNTKTAYATNDYQEKEFLAYAINRYMNPYKYKFYKSRGVTVNEDLFAISELIHWIWRSRVRKGKSINLYFPSKRMRKLLNEYLCSEI